jgi:hypothetical protein
MGQERSYLGKMKFINAIAPLREIYWHHYYRIPLTIAFILLLIVPFLILVQQIDLANELAMYSFYFLVIGIAWELVDYMKSKEKKE